MEGKCGWIIGGGGGGPKKGMLAPTPSKIIGGAWPPLAPPGPPSSYAYDPVRHLNVVRSLRIQYCSKLLKLSNTVELQWLKHLWDHEN